MSVHSLNVLGEMCPLPNLKAKQAISSLEPGDILVIETDHRCAVTGITNEMKRLGHRVRVQEVARGIWQISITKRG